MPLLESDIEQPFTESRPAPKRSALAALRWSLASGLCAGGLWAAIHALAYGLLKSDPALEYGEYVQRDPTIVALLLGGSASVGGLLAGAVVGLARGGTHRGTTALILSAGAALLGAVGGIASVLVIVPFGQWVHPVLSSSFVWALTGMFAGLSAYLLSPWPKESLEETEEEEPLASRRIEWLLREDKRCWHVQPLLSVLPVILVSIGMAICAALAAPSDLSLALLAISVLGLSVTVVLHNQERRLRAMEQRFCQKRESGRQV